MGCGDDHLEFLLAMSGNRRIEAETLSAVAVPEQETLLGFNGFQEAAHGRRQLQHCIANSRGTMRRRMN
jgi:hypothetical protein